MGFIQSVHPPDDEGKGRVRTGAERLLARLTCCAAGCSMLVGLQWRSPRFTSSRPPGTPFAASLP